MFLVGFGLLCIACGIVIGIALTAWVDEADRPRPSPQHHPRYGYFQR
jgi:hypothetical protein